MKFEMIKGGICAVKGVRAYGRKDGKFGLTLIAGKGTVAGAFTINKLRAAPTEFTVKQVARGQLSAIIANSGCANCFTGEQGMRNAEKMAELAATALQVPKAEVAVLSTGSIGTQLDMALIERQLGAVLEGVTVEPNGSMAAARGIMTTDTFPKEVAVRIEDESGGSVVIGGIAKGSGMIAPHLNTATMLAVLYTDAAVATETLRSCLQDAVDDSFNMVLVDGDMSTNDSVLVVATGQRGAIGIETFKEGLTVVCQALAKLMARDGEGATKFVEVTVRDAQSVADAREAARAILRSPLVKSAIFGERLDLVCGRTIAALGAACLTGELDQRKLTISIQSNSTEVLAVQNGLFLKLSESERSIMTAKELFLTVDLGTGGGAEATAWGCDLSYDYVKINAAY
ncbi:MAG TPA: bifunctional ornithine acetyltransferase/N-acetylglutamate synthase [Methanomicrobia archaeon]|nr:bifunctional ornithine acetyltransferase/N-acetylglutamate synthase [Methanomicrobia archaeon]